MRAHSTTQPYQLVVLALLVGLLAACQPRPDEIAEIPTVAVLPTLPPTATLSPTETPTHTPTITLTPSDTPTPTATRTRMPTFTPVPIDVVGICAETMFNSIAYNQNACFGLENDEICAGFGVDNVELQPDVEERLLNRAGTSAATEDILSISTHYNLDDLLWGMALIYMGGDLAQNFDNANRIAMVVYGGTEVRSLVEIDEQAIARQSPNSPPLLDTPFSRMELISTPVDATCNFVPSGVLMQTTLPAVIEVNNVQINFTGTIHIAA